MLERYKNIIFAVVILALVGGVVALLTYRPAPVVITIIPPGPTPTSAPIRVYVTGAVVNALKTYELPVGSRVQDAITAAGGASPNADLLRINLAQPLHDGDQVNIPANAPTDAVSKAPTTSANVISAPPVATANTLSSTSSASGNSGATPSKAAGKTVGVVHINTATSEQLQGLPGVGPSLAEKILDYRSKNGPFKNMDDLDKVPGIGPAKLKEWADLIVFD
ncbi:MAG: ComEA family DNA-binding protein [Chloroflexota bacterium]